MGYDRNEGQGVSSASISETKSSIVRSIYLLFLFAFHLAIYLLLSSVLIKINSSSQHTLQSC